MVSGLNHSLHEEGDIEFQQKNNNRTVEEMLKRKLSSMKIGDEISGDDLSFLEKDASIAINSIKRVSAIKFKINSTWRGKFLGIVSDDSYLTIESNKKISGSYFKQGNKTFTGYKITTYNTRQMSVDGVKFNSYIINDNSGYFNRNPQTISSWKIK